MNEGRLVILPVDRPANNYCRTHTSSGLTIEQQVGVGTTYSLPIVNNIEIELFTRMFIFS